MLRYVTLCYVTSCYVVSCYVLLVRAFFSWLVQVIEGEDILMDKSVHLKALDLWFIMIYYILLGRIFSCPEGKGTRGLQGPIQRCPTSPTPPIRIRKTATAPGSPYSFRIVRGFFYVPQNYQHSRNCETGPPAYRPYPRRLESLTICRWNYKGSTFSSVI